MVSFLLSEQRISEFKKVSYCLHLLSSSRILIQGQNHLADSKIFMIYGTCFNASAPCQTLLLAAPTHTSLICGTVLKYEE